MTKNEMAQIYMRFMEQVDRFEEDEDVTYEFADMLIAAPYVVRDEEDNVTQQGMMLRHTGPYYRRVGLLYEALRITMDRS